MASKERRPTKERFQTYLRLFHTFWSILLIIKGWQSIQFNHSVMSDSLRPHGLQHARPPCTSPTPEAYSNSCLLSWWCHPTISPSVVPFSHLQSCPASAGFFRLPFLPWEAERALLICALHARLRAESWGRQRPGSPCAWVAPLHSLGVLAPPPNERSVGTSSWPPRSLTVLACPPSARGLRDLLGQSGPVRFQAKLQVLNFVCITCVCVLLW